MLGTNKTGNPGTKFNQQSRSLFITRIHEPITDSCFPMFGDKCFWLSGHAVHTSPIQNFPTRNHSLCYPLLNDLECCCVSQLSFSNFEILRGRGFGFSQRTFITSQMIDNVTTAGNELLTT